MSYVNCAVKSSLLLLSVVSTLPFGCGGVADGSPQATGASLNAAAADAGSTGDIGDSKAPTTPVAASSRCGAGTFWCNSLCGVCLVNGHSCGKDECASVVETCADGSCGAGTHCTKDKCERDVTVAAPGSYKKGPPTCGAGTFWCNSLCGVCLVNGHSCGKDECASVAEKCADGACGTATHCVSGTCEL
ncbi:MAG: hypothetical protein NVSMB1_15610 [Polyangiales bacterium]